MESKLIELRDEGTRCLVMAVLFSGNERENALIKDAGWHPAYPVIGMSGNLRGTASTNLWFDPYDMPSSRTFQNALLWLQATPWGDIEPGQVLDIRFVLGETEQPAISEVSA